MSRSPIARSSLVIAVLVVALGLGAAAPVTAVSPGVAPPAPPHSAQLLWRVIPTGVTENLTAVSVVTRTSAMAVAAPSSVLQWNGGAWLAWPAVAPGYISAIAMGSPVEARVVNGYGSARWDGVSWAFTFHPYTGLHAVEAISATQFLAVGDGSAPLPDCTFYRSLGWTWQIEPVNWSGGCTALYDIDMASPDVGWVTGNDSGGGGRFFLRRSGSTWIQVFDPNALSIGRLAVVSDNDVWLTADPQLFHWNGTSWESVPNPSGHWLREIAMVSATDGWVVGEAGTIMHWDGVAWTVVPGPTTANLNGVAMLSPDYGWIVGDGGVALLYGDPGPGYHWVNLPVAMHNQPTPGR